MSASHEMVAPALAEITELARQFGGSVIVETNKRAVIKCSNLQIANRLANRIGTLNHECDIARGRKTLHGYVQAWL